MNMTSCKKKKIICHYGENLPSLCAEGAGAWGSVHTPCLIKECNLDISTHLSKWCLWSDTLNKCPAVTESWLICNRLAATVERVDETLLICPKHRWEYGIGWIPRKSCTYPEHKQTKGKCSPDWRKISPHVADEIFQLFSSPVNQLRVPVGSTWCNNCRLRLHPTLVAKNKEELTKYPCAVCKQEHDNKVEFSVIPCNSAYLVATPHKKKPPASEDDPNFSPQSTSNCDNLNTSMVSIDPQWTPVKYTLHKDYENLSKKTQRKLVRKGLCAMSSVFEAIAPGQSDKLKEACMSPPTNNTTLENLQHAIRIATGRSNKVQLLSVLCTKDENESYHHKIADLMHLFPGTTKHDIEKARKHAGMGKVGMPIETGKYYRTRITTPQITHFLDFVQFSGLVQDVASGTRSIKLSTGAKAIMPNVVRTVHKAEIVRLYEAACDEEGYDKHSGRPSTRTIWNILNNCPASQRKSLSGLDNIAAEGSDAFETIAKSLQSVSNRCQDKKEMVKVVTDALIQGKRYLKGDYKAHCADDDGSIVADHCRILALSDPKSKCFQRKCDHNHDRFCDDCELLKDILDKAKTIIAECESFSSIKEKSSLVYDVTNSITKIYTWKAHILATIHQEQQKNDIMTELNNETAFFIIDFAMKVLPRRYRESMAKWFGKKGNGMHVACAIMRNEKGDLFKKTYIVFIGAAPQDVGTVIAIYQTTLMQIKSDFPHLKYLIDKSDNAGCYHNETLFFWKATWPTHALGLQFKAAMFNERQAGKDQCDRDSATAKRQMKYYIEGGKNIETAAEMNEALRTSTALCGFNSSVLDIEGKSEYNCEEKTITDISKIHSIQFLYEENQVKKLRVWQFYGIGEGKEFPVNDKPAAPNYTVTIPFESENKTFGRAKAKTTKKDIFYCPEVMCIESFASVSLLRRHVDFGKHVYATKNAAQIDKVKDMWVERFAVGSSKSLPNRVFEGSEVQKESLGMGWALSKRTHRRLTTTQKTFLNKLFDKGETSKNKVTPESALTQLRDQLDVEEYLPLSTIKSYFSRRAKALKEGKVVVNENAESDAGEELEDDVEDDTEQEDNSREEAVKLIEVSISKVNLEKDNWVAVAFAGTWFPGQYCQHDSESEEIEIHFLMRSSSASANRFVWPELCGKSEDKSWVDECDVLYTLPEPTKGTRETLQFPQDIINDVDEVYKDWRKKNK